MIWNAHDSYKRIVQNNMVRRVTNETERDGIEGSHKRGLTKLPHQRKHVSGVATSGDTKSLTASYRISNINIHMSRDEILRGLQNFPRERNLSYGENPCQASTPPKLHHAPNGSDCQTAVIELDYRPRVFPQTYGADDTYVMTNEDRRNIFKSPGVLEPEVDALCC